MHDNRLQGGSWGQKDFSGNATTTLFEPQQPLKRDLIQGMSCGRSEVYEVNGVVGGPTVDQLSLCAGAAESNWIVPAALCLDTVVDGGVGALDHPPSLKKGTAERRPLCHACSARPYSWVHCAVMALHAVPSYLRRLGRASHKTREPQISSATLTGPSPGP